MHLEDFKSKIVLKIKNGSDQKELFSFLQSEIKAGNIPSSEIREHWDIINEAWLNKEYIIKSTVDVEYGKLIWEKIYALAKKDENGFTIELLFQNEELKKFEHLFDQYVMGRLDEELNQEIFFYQSRYYGKDVFAKIKGELEKRENFSNKEFQKIKIYDSVIAISPINWLEKYIEHYLSRPEISLTKKIIWADYQVELLFKLLPNVMVFADNKEKKDKIEELFFNFMRNDIIPGMKFVVDIFEVIIGQVDLSEYRSPLDYVKIIAGLRYGENIPFGKFLGKFSENIRSIIMGGEPDNNNIWKPRALLNKADWNDICVGYMKEKYAEVMQNQFPILWQNNMIIADKVNKRQLIEPWVKHLYIPKLDFVVKECKWDFILSDYMRLPHANGFYGGWFMPVPGREAIAIHELSLFSAIYLGKQNTQAKETMHHEVCHLVQYKYNQLKDWIAVNGIPKGYEDLFKRALLQFSVHADMEDLLVPWENRFVSCKDFFNLKIKSAGENLLIPNTDYPSYEKYCNAFAGHDPAFMYNLIKFGKRLLPDGDIDATECKQSINDFGKFLAWNDNYGKKLYGDGAKTSDGIQIPSCSPNQAPFPFNAKLGDQIPNY